MSAEPVVSEIVDTVDVVEDVEAGAAARFAALSPAAQHLRFVLIQDQMRAAAEKVNLLVDMGLTRTTGYTDALALYQTRLADFTEMRAHLGL